jgi:hypothetical protein
MLDCLFSVTRYDTKCGIAKFRIIQPNSTTPKSDQFPNGFGANSANKISIQFRNFNISQL